jgi:glucose-1-phosphate adenylyltransferase
MQRVLAVILAGGAGERLSVLASARAKPALPFGGKYRLIDFALSNCVNSKIEDVVVLAQYHPRSLIRHLGIGQPWDLDRSLGGGLHVLQPYMSRDHEGWYLGTADAVRYNLRDIEEDEPAEVLILAGDHVYTMDYRPLIEAHRTSKADVTIAVREVPAVEASRMGICELDAKGRVVAWEEKPAEPQGNLASMGVYVFSLAALRRALAAAGADFGHDIIPALLKTKAKVHGYRWGGYWRDVGTLDAYWEANLDLTGLVPSLDLFNTDWLIHTRSEERSPAKIGPDALLRHALVSHGCIINGRVENSVLAPGVLVSDGAGVRDSVVLLDVKIGERAVLDRVIVDTGARIGAGAVVGVGELPGPSNEDEPAILFSGLTVIGADAYIPANAYIGRNCRIDPGVRESDFPGLFIASGSTVRHAGQAG